MGSPATFPSPVASLSSASSSAKSPAACARSGPATPGNVALIRSRGSTLLFPMYAPGKPEEVSQFISSRFSRLAFSASRPLMSVTLQYISCGVVQPGLLLRRDLLGPILDVSGQSLAPMLSVIFMLC